MLLRAIQLLLIVCTALLIEQPSGAVHAPLSGDGHKTARNKSIVVYHLKKGEGLATVSRRFGVPLGTLIRINRSRLPRKSDPNFVFTGMSVLVPVKAPAEHKASPGVSTQAEPEAKSPSTVPTKHNAKQGKPQPAKPAVKPEGESKPIPAGSPDLAKAAVEKPSPSQPETSTTGSRPAMPPAAPAHGPVAQKNPSSIPLIASIPGGWETVVWIALLVSVLLLGASLWLARRSAQFLANGAARETNGLQLVASRELGKNSRVFWLRAGEKDLFVSTGADTQILAVDEQSDPEPAAVAETTPKAPPTRRPRKNGLAKKPSQTQTELPNSSTGQETGNPTGD